MHERTPDESGSFQAPDVEKGPERSDVVERPPDGAWDNDIQQGSLLGGRILLVEDDYFIAFDLRMEMVRRGAEVIGPVGNLDMASEIARSEPLINAAVIDINLHGKFAFQLVDELIGRDILVVFCTGHDEHVVPHRLRNIRRFVKPILASEIAQGIACLFAERGPTQE
jgi:DNA-binding LytR/AlgR family response regulator